MEHRALRRTRNGFLLATLVVVISSVAASSYTLLRLRAEAIDHHLQMAALNAQVLESQLSESFTVIDRTLANLGRGPLSQHALLNALGRAPYLRSVSFVDDKDTIVISTNARNIGLQLDHAQFHPSPDEPVEALRAGLFMAGRDHYDGSLVGFDEPTPPIGHLPVIRSVRISDDAWQTVAAAINPDYFLNLYAKHVSPEQGVVELVRYDGYPLFGTQASRYGFPGPVLEQLADKDFGTLREQHPLGDTLTAFRSSRNYPFVLIFRFHESHALASWRDEVVQTLMLVGGILLGTLTLAGLYFLRLQRTLMARARDHMQLQIAAIAFETQEGMVVTDAAGAILRINSAFSSITGYTADEAIGQSMRILKSDQHSAEFYKQMFKVLHQKGHYAGEVTNRHRDGSLHPHYISITCVYDKNGQITHYVGSLSDMTERKLSDQKMSELNRDFVAFLENTSDFVYFKDRDSRFRFCSQTLATITGHSSWRDMVGKHDREVFPADTAHIYAEEERQVFGRGEALINKIAPYYDSRGELAWVSTSKWPLFDSDARVVGLFGISRDVTAQKRTEDRLQLAASVFTHAREGIMITTADSQIVEVNDAFVRITGYPREEIVGKHPGVLKSGRQGADFYAELWRTLKERGHWTGEIWNRRRSGEVYAEMLTISAVHGPEGQVKHYVALFSDITAQKDHELELEHIAHFDPLTGLPNRLLLTDRLHQGMAQTRRNGRMLMIAYIDLDGFKEINDLHGHDAGDHLLVVLADRMKQSLRESDTIARLGGDEFVAVLSELSDFSEGEPLISRLLSVISEPVNSHGVILQVSGSIGVSVFGQHHGFEADQLLRQADHAMYQAKIAGKNRYCLFDAELDRSARDFHESINRIQAGLENREFLLYFQPKVSLRDGKVIGVEALIRWQHPEEGLLLPSRFLPAVMNRPLGIELSEWVIDTALQQIEAWQQDGQPLPVSINIDSYFLECADFAERLRRLLLAHPSVAPELIELEVLETSALEDISHVSQIIRSCNELGVSFALDDFGTGYSSLAYLKKLAARVLKIDQSFVRDILHDPDDLSILEGVLGLAHAFRLEVIAEGVETVEQGQLLLQLGCDRAQGYAIARPMPGKALREWMKHWRPHTVWQSTARLSPRDFALLYTGSELRKWVSKLLEHGDDVSEWPSTLNPDRCHFTDWLTTLDSVERTHSTICEMISLHRQTRQTCCSLLSARATGVHCEAAELDELRVMSDHFLERLQQLIKLRESTAA